MSEAAKGRIVTCVHHWLLEPAPSNAGECRKCGARREFGGGEKGPLVYGRTYRRYRPPRQHEQRGRVDFSDYERRVAESLDQPLPSWRETAS